IQFDDKYLPVDPYLVGMYIADGSDGWRITKKSGPVGDYIQSLDPTLTRRDYESTVGYLKFEKSSPIRQYVVDSGLANVKSRDKFIPNELFQKHTSVRWRLLQGLMDGDGRVPGDMDN